MHARKHELWARDCRRTRSLGVQESVDASIRIDFHGTELIGEFIGPQNQGRCRFFLFVKRDDLSQRQIDQHVRVDDDKRALAKKRFGFQKTAAGVEQLALFRIADLKPEFSAIPQVSFNPIAQVVQIDNDLADAVAAKEQERVVDHWTTGHGHKGLRDRLRQRLQPMAQACGKDHRLHRISSKCSARIGRSFSVCGNRARFRFKRRTVDGINLL